MMVLNATTTDGRAMSFIGPVYRYYEYVSTNFKRLTDEGWIERQIAVLSADKLGTALGHGLSALVEVTLDAQGAEHLDAFEQRACADDAVQQCWRVSPGPDFVLVIQAADMPHYLAITQRLLTQDANVRNVKAFFATQRAKFTSTWPVMHKA